MPDSKKSKSDVETATRPRRRWRRWLWRSMLAYILLSVVLSFIPERPVEVKIVGDAEETRVDGTLAAGAARVVITPPEKWWGEMRVYDEDPPIEGVIDDIHARALVLGAQGETGRIAFVSVEMLTIPPPLRPAVKVELAARGLDDVHLVLSATHMHTGPGNFWDVPFSDLYMGDVHEGFMDFLVARIADAVENATLAMEPAVIGFARTPTSHLVRHRRYKEPVTGLRPPVDETLQLIRVDSADASHRVIAYVVNLGLHPTQIMHRTGKRIAGGLPGEVSRRLEDAQGGAVALFVQGACGSVRSTSPRPYAGYAGEEDDKFAKVAMQADMTEYFVREAEKHLFFDEHVSMAAATIRTALPGADAHFFPEERPWQVVRVLTIIPNWLFNRFADAVAIADEGTFVAVRINDAYIFGFPADLSNRLGWELKQYVKRPYVFVLSHTDDYAMGYVLSREEYDMGGIGSLAASERGQCYFGKRAGGFCVEAAHILANMVREEGAEDVFLYGVGDGPSRMPDGTKLE